jgi:hypothetical protein
MVVEVRHVLGQHRREMVTVDDQYPIQQFAAGSSNGSVALSRRAVENYEKLGIRVAPQASGRADETSLSGPIALCDSARCLAFLAPRTLTNSIEQRCRKSAVICATRP